MNLWIAIPIIALTYAGIALLFSMMVIIACLELSGFIRPAAGALMERTHSPRARCSSRA